MKFLKSMLNLSEPKIKQEKPKPNFCKYCGHPLVTDRVNVRYNEYTGVMMSWDDWTHCANNYCETHERDVSL